MWMKKEDKTVFYVEYEVHIVLKDFFYPVFCFALDDNAYRSSMH